MTDFREGGLFASCFICRTKIDKGPKKNFSLEIFFFGKTDFCMRKCAKTSFLDFFSFLKGWGMGGGDGGLIFVKIAETYLEPHQTFKILIGKIKRITEAFLEPC